MEFLHIVASVIGNTVPPEGWTFRPIVGEETG